MRNFLAGLVGNVRRGWRLEAWAAFLNHLRASGKLFWVTSLFNFAILQHPPLGQALADNHKVRWPASEATKLARHESSITNGSNREIGHLKPVILPRLS